MHTNMQVIKMTRPHVGVQHLEVAPLQTQSCKESSTICQERAQEEQRNKDKTKIKNYSTHLQLMSVDVEETVPKALDIVLMMDSTNQVLALVIHCYALYASDRECAPTAWPTTKPTALHYYNTRLLPASTYIHKLIEKPPTISDELVSVPLKGYQGYGG